MLFVSKWLWIQLFFFFISNIFWLMWFAISFSRLPLVPCKHAANYSWKCLLNITVLHEITSITLKLKCFYRHSTECYWISLRVKLKFRWIDFTKLFWVATPLSLSHYIFCSDFFLLKYTRCLCFEMIIYDTQTNIWSIQNLFMILKAWR